MRTRLLIPLTLVTAALLSAQQVPTLDELEFPPLGEVHIPDVARFELPNGMRVFLLENRELPLISGRALVRTGNLFDPPDKIGLAGFTGEVMRSGGTAEMTGDEIDVRLENMAASVEAGIGETSGSVSFSCLTENVDDVLAIFHDILTAPEFRQDKLNLALTQYASVIARRNDDASGIAAREYAETLYGKDTPYGWRIEFADLANIGRDDLVAFHDRYFFPENVILSVQGDFSAEEMHKRLEALFADWNVKREPVPEFPSVDTEPDHVVHVADKPDVNQTFIRIGHLGGTLRDDDYPALTVMADILGGGFSSRLFKKIRTELGWAYGVGAGWNANYNHPGQFTISGSTKSSTTTDTIETILQEVDRLRTEEVTDEELDTAKSSVLNSFVFAFEQPTETLNRLVSYTYFVYPEDFIFQYQRGVEAVTKADILRVAKEHIHPEQFTVVAVGNIEEIGRPLSELGLEVDPIDLTIPPPPGADGGQQ